jgi:hypothetical protein
MRVDTSRTSRNVTSLNLLTHFENMITLGLFSATTQTNDTDLVVLYKNGQPTGKKDIRISAIRAYLLGPGTAQYSLNAAVRIARFVASTLNLPYTVTTDLSGNASDDALLVPDSIALGIVLLQAHRGLSVDGIAGADFIRKIMGLHQDIAIAAHCRAAFMDESNNKNVVGTGGRKVKLPNFKAEESVAYTFLRDITLARNGLWSDKPHIVNFTALRLEHSQTNIQWDDTIGACWVDETGKKFAKIYTATTEPGNRKLFKTMIPQTIIFQPGYHQGKLPAMRGYCLVASDPTIKFPNRLLFTSDDSRGLNLHPGGTTGAMKNLVKYILPVGANTESEFRAVLVIMEIFEILSRWGLDPQRPAWDNLAGWAAAKALRAGTASGGMVPVFQDEKTTPVRQITIATARGWLAKKWSTNRPMLLRILRSVDPAFMPPGNFNALNTKGLEQLVTDRHIAGIVQRQCDYFFDVKEVDGLAGNTYLNLLHAGIAADGALAQKANVDFARMQVLLAQFSGSNSVLTAKRRDYVKQIKTNPLAERAKLLEAEARKALEVSGQNVAENVGTWSILCQVVFGPEMFYEMMGFAVNKALETGQRRWYYTLIDQASVPG